MHFTPHSLSCGLFIVFAYYPGERRKKNLKLGCGEQCFEWSVMISLRGAQIIVSENATIFKLCD